LFCIFLFSGFIEKKYIQHLGKATGILLISWIVTILVICMIGFLTDLIGQPMSWFTNTWLLIGLYAAPAGLVMLFINEAAKFILFDGVCWMTFLCSSIGLNL